MNSGMRPQNQGCRPPAIAGNVGRGGRLQRGGIIVGIEMQSTNFLRKINTLDLLNQPYPTIATATLVAAVFIEMSYHFHQ
jgi:hypothetical protein